MAPTTAASIDSANKQVTALERECAKNQPKIKDVLTNLEAAIAKKSGPMLELYLDRVEETSGLISDTLRDASAALKALNELRKDKDAIATRFNLIKDLTAKADKTKERLAGELLKLKELEKKALALRDELAGGKEEAVEKYAELEDKVNDKKAALEKKRAELVKQVAAADKAVGANDNRALTAARGKIIDLRFTTEALELKGLDRALDDFMKKYKAAGLNTDAQWLKDEIFKLQGITEKGEAEQKRLLAIGQLAPAAKAPERKPALTKDQVAKVGKTFGVQPKDLDKLGKVLNGFPYDKWAVELSTLARNLKLPVQDGRKLVSMISGYDFVKQLYLIDI